MLLAKSECGFIESYGNNDQYQVTLFLEGEWQSRIFWVKGDVFFLECESGKIINSSWQSTRHNRWIACIRILWQEYQEKEFKKEVQKARESLGI